MPKANKATEAKGQAALEYLMTYGWAIVVVIAIIAILAFIVRPQPPETCQPLSPQPFECISGAYTLHKSTNMMTIAFKNNGQYKLKVAQTACGINESGQYIGLMDITGTAGEISSGSTKNIDFNCSALVPSDVRVGQDVFQGYVYLIYYPRAEDTTLNTTASIKTIVRYSP